jgi:glycosyltransferase involved in cell wall biosynthesis
LDAFDQVCVTARVRNVACVDQSWHRADGPGVSFIPIPYYLGPRQFAWRAPQIHRAIGRAVRSTDAAILRAPSIIANVAERALKRACRPYAAEIVGDPDAVFAPGVVDHPLRPFLRLYVRRRLAIQCRQAIGVAYVTKNALQRLYPPNHGTLCASYPDVELSDEAFASRVRRDFTRTPLTLIAVGTMAQRYKGFDLLLRALNQCVSDGLPLRLSLIGDGRYRPELESLARHLRIDHQVVFRGQLPSGCPVRDQLDQGDVFVMPSRTEGMPNALIEAMARGLPSVGTAVGGIPELLDEDDLVEPGNANALAAKIRAVVSDPDRMTRMAARNLETVRPFHNKSLRRVRREFYRSVRETTENWQPSGSK